MFGRFTDTVGLLIIASVPAFSQTGGCPGIGAVSGGQIIGAVSGGQVGRTESVFTFGFPQIMLKRGLWARPFPGR